MMIGILGLSALIWCVVGWVMAENPKRSLRKKSTFWFVFLFGIVGVFIVRAKDKKEKGA